MPTELAKAYVQILPTTQGIKDEIEKILGPAGDKSGKESGKKAAAGFIAKFGPYLKQAAVGLIGGAIIKGALTETAQLEQNLGGTEAVFGKYAKSIQTQATNAYKNMGMSASEYMSTANKMGSLFQGSGLTQQRSLELTSQAMQRAADVASVMGIDTTWAMESIAGAAKGNFSMMDNLGVAMNATTLEAYAASKGMTDWSYATASGAEKSEMAMQMFLEKTSQYAGNFARESAETLSGSLDSVKASWKNLMGAIGSGENIQPMMEALMTSAQNFLSNLIPVLANILVAIPATLLPMIAQMLPMLLSSVITLLQTLVTTLIPQLPAILVSLITGIVTAVTTLIPQLLLLGIQMLQAVIQGIVTMIPTLIAAIPQIIETAKQGIADGVPKIKEAAVKLWESIKSALADFIPKLKEKLPTILLAISTFLGNSITSLFENAGKLFNAIITAIGPFLGRLIAALPQIIVTIVGKIISWAPQILTAAGQALLAIVTAIGRAAINVATAAASMGRDLIMGLIRGIGNATSWLFGWISSWVSSVLSWIKGLFHIGSPSKETMWMGEMLMQGLAIGMTDNLKPVKKAIDEVGDVTTGALTDTLTVSASAAGELTPAAGETTLDQLVALTAAIMDRLDKMKIYLDGETLVGGIVDNMDDALGNKGILAGRGVV